MNKMQTAEEFCRYVWHSYLVDRRYDKLLDIMADDASVIGTGAHEISRNLEEFITMMTRESKEWNGSFLIKDQWYQTMDLSDMNSLVIGEIVVREDAEDGILYDISFRFSIVLKRWEDSWRILHVHQSVSDPSQAADEFFPHHMVEKDENQIIYNLRHDIMTGLLNRVYMKETVDRFIGKTPRGVLVMMDIDKFKNLNDSFGHPFGDKVLIAFSQSLMASFANNVVGRIGGDEFVCYLPGVETPQELEKFIHPFREDWRERQKPLGISYEITSSIGAAFCPQCGMTYEELWKCADKALYRAKVSGAGELYCEIK